MPSFGLKEENVIFLEIHMPDITAALADKGHFHQIMLATQMSVPETVIVNRSELNGFKITDKFKANMRVARSGPTIQAVRTIGHLPPDRS
jgi:hypothetical protein